MRLFALSMFVPAVVTAPIPPFPGPRSATVATAGGLRDARPNAPAGMLAGGSGPVTGFAP